MKNNAPYSPRAGNMEHFVFVSKNDSIEDVSLKMEEYRRFTAPVLDENMKLEGWITSFNITKGLREGKTKKIPEKKRNDPGSQERG